MCVHVCACVPSSNTETSGSSGDVLWGGWCEIKHPYAKLYTRKLIWEIQKVLKHQIKVGYSQPLSPPPLCSGYRRKNLNENWRAGEWEIGSVNGETHKAFSVSIHTHQEFHVPSIQTNVRLYWVLQFDAMLLFVWVFFLNYQGALGDIVLFRKH